MRSLIQQFKENYDAISLIAALILLLVAISNPSIEVGCDIYNYVIFVDVTQSMNVQDMVLEGLPVSRLEYTRHLLKESIKSLPCGTRVGLGIFYKANAVLLYTPIEACSNYATLLDTIDHLDWRMASHGSSHIRFGLQSIATTLLTMGEPTQVAFVTDGDEAPPLNALSKTGLENWQGGQNWLLIGVGGDKPAPIPKFNSKNEVVGYWSIYAIKVEPAAVVSEESTGTRDDSIASDSYEYYLSKLDESYMKELAIAIHAQYIRAGKSEDLVNAMLNQKSAIHTTSKYALNWIFAMAALIFMVSAYIPHGMEKLRGHKLK